MLQSIICIFISGLKFVAMTIKILKNVILNVTAIATNFNPEMNIEKLHCNIICKK
jgi:hypothetical protein